ncbi:DNA-binding response regulator [Amphritea sp. 1_MG-2023]|uniref:response regulator transcription factor n=1 Tax=Amphritea sp. 1_MG-2023 TaxID=3062670 RepID=UPI0026E32988|nr:DNA-binding response regulator [Amphritea sp. 1_MG-2023]MDO6561959.1 DNA-binding response regulator [Amphritea sp. 1_MG-2023]
MSGDKASMRNDVVLVVDDSPNALSLINDALEGAGLDILVALEGRQALTICQRIRPDIILMDAVMPVMDGFETCRALKADPHLAAIPVVFMTGLTDTDDIVRGLDSGGVDYLIKPINPNELLARIRVHLNNARQTSSVHSALDSTGQHLLTVGEGQIRWATPRAYALLHRAEVTEAVQAECLLPQIRSWLEHHPSEQDRMRLRDLDYPLTLKLIGYQSSGEVLMQLIDGRKPTGAELLKLELELTEREAEVLFWLANGKTNREIAEILEISPRTINKHLEQIFPKLGVENRTAAAGVALRLIASHE